jgi:hypothetical protein
VHEDLAYRIRLPLEGIDPITFLLFISEPPPPQTLTRVPIWLIDDEEDGGEVADLKGYDDCGGGDGGERPAAEEGEGAGGGQGLRRIPGGRRWRGGRDVQGGGEGVPCEACEVAPATFHLLTGGSGGSAASAGLEGVVDHRGGGRGLRRRQGGAQRRGGGCAPIAIRVLRSVQSRR